MGVYGFIVQPVGQNQHLYFSTFFTPEGNDLDKSIRQQFILRRLQAEFQLNHCLKNQGHLASFEGEEKRTAPVKLLGVSGEGAECLTGTTSSLGKIHKHLLIQTNSFITESTNLHRGNDLYTSQFEASSGVQAKSKNRSVLTGLEQGDAISSEKWETMYPKGSREQSELLSKPGVGVSEKDLGGCANRRSLDRALSRLEKHSSQLKPSERVESPEVLPLMTGHLNSCKTDKGWRNGGNIDAPHLVPLNRKEDAYADFCKVTGIVGVTTLDGDLFAQKQFAVWKHADGNKTAFTIIVDSMSSLPVAHNVLTLLMKTLNDIMAAQTPMSRSFLNYNAQPLKLGVFTRCRPEVMLVILHHFCPAGQLLHITINDVQHYKALIQAFINK